MTGIDYGMGLTNIDLKTGIRYGVINQNRVLQAWAEESEPVFPEPDEEGDFFEPIGFEYSGDGYEASCGEDGDIFITKSRYYTLCGFCSPCAPGAGYLTDAGDIKAYCFNHDWFEEKKAPYVVYRVKDNSIVDSAIVDSTIVEPEGE